MTKNTPYYLAFSLIYGIGPVIFKELVNHFGSAKNAFEAKKDALESLLGPRVTAKIIDFKVKFEPDKYFSDFEKKKIKILTLEDADYPVALKAISDPPICLYVRGNEKIFAENDLFFSIVGTRKVSSYGQEIAEEFAASLARYGFVIVSGMAIGIDAIAHWVTVTAGGKTVAVLGCGVDIIYPAQNARLYHKIIETGGAVISEFPPGMSTLPGLFVARNRIVSGLSRGVLIVEGAQRSGTLITAGYAASQGRDVFAPPSPITSPTSQAPNSLLKQGAKLVTSVQDILEEYNINFNVANKKNLLMGKSGLEKNILELIIAEPHSADELGLKLVKSVSEILNSLSLLEIEGSVKKNSQGKYLPRS